MDVVDVQIILKTGASYADSPINIEDAMSADGRFVITPVDTVFEVKFPNADIAGTIV